MDGGGSLLKCWLVAALPLEITALFLGLQTPLHSTPTWTRGLPRWRRRLEALPQEIRQPSHGGLAVLPLGPLLSGYDSQTTIGQP
jgi:hypothetical protein